MLNFILFIILFNLIISSSNPIKLQFTKKIVHPTEEFLIIRDNEFYTDIEIGTPKITISSKISMEYSPFIIRSSIIDGLYNENNSLTYSKKGNLKTDFYLELFKEGYYSYDKITLDSNSFDSNLTFILATKDELKKKVPNGFIGLKIEDNNFVREQVLINQLKNNKLIKNNCFFINFNNKNDNKGEIIIGNYPHEYDKNYNENNLHSTKVSDINNNWKIIFDKILWNNQSLSKVNQAKFSLDSGVIFGSDELYENIEAFFYEYQSFCNLKEYFKDSHIYFVCNKNFDIKKFPEITCYSKDLNSTFILDYNDLFYKKEDFYYLLIVFGDYQNDIWILGKPFLKKYHIIFDIDKKVVSYYSENAIKGKENKILIWFIIVILALIIGGLGYLIYKKYNLQRKKRINEISDEYDYTPQINSDNNYFNI